MSTIAAAIVLCGAVAFGEEGGPARPGADDDAWVAAHAGTLPLWFNTEFPPIEFVSDQGAFIGMGADVIGLVEKRLGVSFPRRPSDDWNAHLAALESGACAIAPTIVKTRERQRYLYFTKPYATVPVVIIGTRRLGDDLTIDNLAGLRVAVVSGYATEKYLMDRSKGRLTMVSMPDVLYGLRAVSFGQVDAFVGNLAVAAYHIDKAGIPNLRVVGRTDYAFRFSIGVSRKYPQLFAAVDKALDDIPTAELEAVRKRWISLQGREGVSPETRQFLVLVSAFTVLLIAGLSAVTYFLKRRLNEKIVSLKAAQEDLAASESRFRAIFDHAPYAIVINRLDDGRYIDANQSFLRSRGLTREDLDGKSPADYEITSDMDTGAVLETLKRQGAVTNVEAAVPRDDGSHAHVLYSSVLLELQGQQQILSMTVDITDWKHAEAERQRLQEQLLQSQKLEAVGILAGGVAHDFNNMLGAIIGYAELSLQTLPADAPVRQNLEKILDAAERSARLTRQLLAFARKQTVTPVLIDINDAIETLLKMLRRLIGENIELVWAPGDGVLTVYMDPTQLDQLLTNLCVNARDAIGDIGRITIRTESVRLDAAESAAYADGAPGDYIRLTVSDTGCGMDTVTLTHVFEPFYTTKGPGKGTGLGLSTVYGIVKQNEGFLNLTSAPDAGTTFEIFIPRHTGAQAPAHADAQDDGPRSRGETILLVEDDAALGDMVTLMLQRLGYTVLAAATPGEAIGVSESAAETIHLLLTDVVMPEMNGRELADRLVHDRPGIMKLFMSGYTSDLIVHRGVLDEGINFIQKPFTMKALAEKIRAVLDGTESGSGHEPASSARRSR